MTPTASRPRILSAAFVCALLLATALGHGAGAADPAPGARESALRAVAWLRGQQGPEGDVLNTDWVLLAAAAVDDDPSRWRAPGGATPVAWLEAHPPDPLDALAVSLRILALVSAYEDPRGFGGRDHVADLLRLHLLGQIGDPRIISDDYFAIYALVAAGLPPDHPAIQDAASTLLAAQEPDGSWGSSSMPNADETAAALAALRLAGRDGAEARQKAMQYLSASRGPDGEFRSPNLNPIYSTSWVLWGLATAGDPMDLAPRARQWLAAKVGPSGCVLAGNRCDGWATWQVAHGLSGTPMPPRRMGAEAGILAPPTADRAHDVVLRAQAEGARAWRWDFGDGTVGEGPVVSHRYQNLGTFDVALYVEGEDRRSSRAEASILVQNLAPLVTLRAPEAPLHHKVSLPFVLEASDPDGPKPELSVDFGDGTVVPVDGGGSIPHAYGSPGVYRVLAKAQDVDGTTALAEEIVVVTNRAPVLRLSLPENATRIEDVLLRALGEDPDGDPLVFRWEVEGLERTGHTLQHRFVSLGDHTVRVSLEDGHGGMAAAEGSVRVRNLPPEIGEARVPLEAEEGDVPVVSAAVTDPDGPDPEVAWLLDGQPLDGVPLAEGRHAILLRVTDADGLAVEREWAVAVRARPTQETGEPVSSTEPIQPHGDGPRRLVVTPQEALSREAVEVRLEGGWSGRVLLDFGDGGSDEIDASVFPMRHTYARAGTYVLQATATASGTTTAHQAQVRIKNQPPTLLLEGVRRDDDQVTAWGRATDADGAVVEVEAWTANGALKVEGTGTWQATLLDPGVALAIHARARDDEGAWGEVAAIRVEAAPKADAAGPAAPSSSGASEEGIVRLAEAALEDEAPIEGRREAHASAALVLLAMLLVATPRRRR